jgi:hypothetical protein
MRRYPLSNAKFTWRWLFSSVKKWPGTQRLLVLCGTLSICGCVEPYQPPEVQENVDLLVVDGFLDMSTGSATVRLSHAISLSSATAAAPESGATVAILDASGTSYGLIETAPGTYAIDELVLDPASKFMLSLRTANGVEYISDYSEPLATPPIDSVTWSGDEDGLTILVNAHDATRVAQYYYWDYIETWKYNAQVSSEFIFINGTPEYRTNDQRIHTCWQTQESTKISIASVERLAENVIHEFPVTFIPKGSTKLSVTYSILVRQRAISKQEYNFLEQLQKTTESLGGLFDPQPSQVLGNIHGVTNSSHPVLGYFSAGMLTEERIFVDFYDLPDPIRKYYPMAGCEVDTVEVADLGRLLESTILGTAIYSESGATIIAYTISIPRCADCRTQGGVLEKPPFWPN